MFAEPLVEVFEMKMKMDAPSFLIHVCGTKVECNTGFEHLAWTNHERRANDTWTTYQFLMHACEISVECNNMLENLAWTNHVYRNSFLVAARNPQRTARPVWFRSDVGMATIFLFSSHLPTPPGSPIVTPAGGEHLLATLSLLTRMILYEWER